MNYEFYWTWKRPILLEWILHANIWSSLCPFPCIHSRICVDWKTRQAHHRFRLKTQVHFFTECTHCLCHRINHGDEDTRLLRMTTMMKSLSSSYFYSSGLGRRACQGGAEMGRPVCWCRLLGQLWNINISWLYCWSRWRVAFESLSSGRWEKKGPASFPRPAPTEESW